MRCGRYRDGSSGTLYSFTYSFDKRCLETSLQKMSDSALAAAWEQCSDPQKKPYKKKQEELPDPWP